jgi:SAM-dependent methyltransferase
MTAALDLYAAGLEGAPLHLRERDGQDVPLPVARWIGPLTAADGRVLDRAAGPVLDIGCGPGRHVLALARRGVHALGVDISAAAIRLARTRGARVVQGDVFGPVPGDGTWRSALLLDGNVGIGGDPVALLARVRQLLRADGRILAELAPPGTHGGAREVRLEGALGASEWFAWATVGADEVDDVAARAGMRVAALWHDERRWFAALGAA